MTHMRLLTTAAAVAACATLALSAQDPATASLRGNRMRSW